MTVKRDVAVLVGSLRKESWSLKVAAAVAALAPASLSLRTVQIRNLPLYDEDLEKSGPPEEWRTFRQEIQTADAVLFVTPEYNRSVPGALKNALDVGSRPYGRSVWSKKPAAIISNSPGAIGAFGANHHLRQSLVFLDMPILQQPEAYIGNVSSLFDSDGHLINESTRAFLRKFAEAFSDWIERNCASR